MTTREKLGREGYERAWIDAFERYVVWQWETGWLKLGRRVAA